MSYSVETIIYKMRMKNKSTYFCIWSVEDWGQDQQLHHKQDQLNSQISQEFLQPSYHRQFAVDLKNGDLRLSHVRKLNILDGRIHFSNMVKNEIYLDDRSAHILLSWKEMWLLIHNYLTE